MTLLRPEERLTRKLVGLVIVSHYNIVALCCPIDSPPELELFDARVFFDQLPQREVDSQSASLH